MRIARVFVLCLLPALAAAQPVQVLHRFTPSPAQPNGPLVQFPGGHFYGVTTAGVIRLTSTGQVTEIARFADQTPTEALVVASDGGLYGVTRNTASGGRGTIFRVDPATGEHRTIHVFGAQSGGSEPIGGLVEVGGSLYGVTRYGPGSLTFGTIFHLELATGDVITDHAFGEAQPFFSSPSTPLTQGADGLLYGGTPNSLYRFDPSTRVVTRVRELTTADGLNPGQLTLGADSRLYGAAARGGVEDAGTIFRYDPSTNLFQRLYSLTPSNGVDGQRPGPLVAGGDGHFYGVTDLPNNGSAGWTVFRVRAGVGGTFTYETLRVLDEDIAGTPTQARLTRGADGLIYGFAQAGGPTYAGTGTGTLPDPPGQPGAGALFRFDPAESSPPPNAIAFTVLHTFPLLTTWNPSTPVPAADGFLYGLTRAGGATNRGAVYRLSPGTGVATILGDVPGALTGRTANSTLVAAPDGLLYGVSTTFAPSPVEHRIVRVDPATGLATTAVTTSAVTTPGELVRTPAGALYGAQRSVTPRSILRFDPGAGTVTTVASLPEAAGLFLSPLTATSDGQVYAVAQRLIPNPLSSRLFTTRTSLLRLNTASSTGVDDTVLGDQFEIIDRLAEGAGGALYLASAYRGTASIHRVEPATGGVSLVCTVPGRLARLEHLSAGPDGALYGFVVTPPAQRLFRCDPATAAVTVTALPPDVGVVTGPLVTFSGLLYGATTGPTSNGGGALIRLAPGTTLPPLDTDGDGLPNAWETAYRLDPFDAAAGSGAADDPDGDGRTNAQEFADGTHPRGVTTRLFAEGATGAFFRTRFDIANPGTDPGTVRIRFQTDTGTVVGTDLFLLPSSHLDLDPATLPGLASATFSTIVESDVAIAVDRTMTWGASGYGSHLETGVAAPSTTWFFAEGSTSGEFALFYLLQNPQQAAVTATVTYLRPAPLPPIVRTYTLPPASRTTIVVDADSAELASTDLSAAITATAPIVAERAMYLSKPGQPFAAGHESAGVPAAALEWFLAEGATGTFFDLFVLIANPGTSEAVVEVEYLQGSGAPLTRTYRLPASSRLTIWVDDEELPAGSGQKPLAAGTVSTVVRSTNGVPVIAERAMWWPGAGGAGDFWSEAHNSPGATGTATRWMVGGGEVGGSDGAETYILIANTTSTAARARVSVLADDPGFLTWTVDVPAKSRVTVPLSSPGFSAPVPAGRYGVVVESLGPTLVPLVVERATYGSPGGVFWGRGGNALASPLP